MGFGLLHFLMMQLKNYPAADFASILFSNLCFMQQSVSVTAEHDPIVGFSLAPKKCLSSDEIDDEPRSSQISPTQLSSNKLARHSQIE